jgi:hypothetical protein
VTGLVPLQYLKTRSGVGVGNTMRPESVITVLTHNNHLKEKWLEINLHPRFDQRSPTLSRRTSSSLERIKLPAGNRIEGGKFLCVKSISENPTDTALTSQVSKKNQLNGA